VKTLAVAIAALAFAAPAAGAPLTLDVTFFANQTIG
jgi:hypothetical protein